MELHGGYYILASLPIWASAGLLYAITLGAILVGRDVLEGLPYNVAYSAFIGEAGLMIGVLVAATVLKRDGIYQRSWLLRNIGAIKLMKK